jgi:hypothetical protein
MAWLLEAYDGLHQIWKGTLPKDFDEAEVVEVLRLLVARHLTEDEILRAAKGKEDLLTVWHNHEARTISTAASNPCYIATKDQADA